MMRSGDGNDHDDDKDGNDGDDVGSDDVRDNGASSSCSWWCSSTV